MGIVGLSKQATWHLSKFKGWVRRGLGYTKIKQELAELGYKAWKKEVLQQDIRLLKGVEKQGALMKFYKRKDLLPEKLYTTGIKPPEVKYKTLCRAEGVNLTTGEKETRHHWVVHDELQTRGTIEEEARSRLEADPSLFLVEKITPIEGGLFRFRREI